MISRVQLQSPQLFWLSMVALAAALTAVVWLYRPQVKPLRAPWWWLLLGLRIVVLSVLAISILRPTIVRPEDSVESGVVAILVDQSSSMGVVDSSRQPSELVPLADALDALPAGVRSGTLVRLRLDVDALRQQVDEVARAHSELEYARLAERGIASAETHLRAANDDFAQKVKTLRATADADASTAPLSEALARIAHEPTDPPDAWSAAESDQISKLVERIDSLQESADQALYDDNAQVRSACDQIARESRVQLVQRALAGQGTGGSEGLIARLNANHQPVRLFGFCGASAPAGALEPLPTPPPQDLPADGVHSDPAGALREVRQRLALQHVTAAVVFSDGREVGSDTASAGATWSDVPVIAVSPAPATTRDVAVAWVSLPPSAPLGQTIAIDVELQASGFDGKTMQVTLSGSGVAPQTASATIESGAASAEFELRLDRAGPQELSVGVEPQPGEATLQNNQLSRIVKVISDKTHVALMGGFPDWDYQYLRAALLRSRGIDATVQRVDEHHPGLAPAKILEQDVVILNNLDASALDERQWDALRRLAGDQGGSVILIVTDPAVAASYASQPSASVLLPWHGENASPLTRTWPGEDAMFRVVPTGPDVIQTFRLSDDPDPGAPGFPARSKWNELPTFYRFLAMPPLKPDVRALLVERESGLPILTVSRLGAGRVLLLAMDEVWRWKPAMAPRDQDRFWLGLIRCAAGEPYAISDGNLSLDADQLQIEADQPLHVRARIRSLVGFENEELAEPVALKISRAVDAGNPLATPVRSDEFVPVAGSPDRFELTVPGLPVGDYEMRLVAADRSLSLPLRVSRSKEAELRDVSGDEQALQRLSGPRGQVIGLADVKSLPQRLAADRDTQPRYAEFRLWDSPYLFLFVVGCLGIEWAVRKRVGLA